MTKGNPNSKILRVKEIPPQNSMIDMYEEYIVDAGEMIGDFIAFNIFCVFCGSQRYLFSNFNFSSNIFFA